MVFLGENGSQKSSRSIILQDAAYDDVMKRTIIHIRLFPSQDVHFGLILWYIAKIIPTF